MSILGVIATFIWQHLGSILISCLLLHFVGNYLTPGVRSVPGPFWARFTNLWRFIDVARGEAQVTLLKLHRKHGPYVRLGPNVVSVNDLNMLKHIYGVNKGYKKVVPLILLFQSLSAHSPDSQMRTDQILRGSAAAGPWKAYPDTVHHLGRGFPCQDQATNFIVLLNEWPSRV
jgi:hypothetical protein